MTAQRIVLASASPRRRELIARFGVPIVVALPAYDESNLSGVPESVATEHARGKARAVRPEYRSDWIVAADTVVTYDGVVLGKPVDRSGAERMLRGLAGRTHEVITGVSVYAPHAHTCVTRFARTAVRFRPLADEEIEWYLETGEWDDAAGSYKIQGAAALFCDEIVGSYTNVVGLPLQLLYGILRTENFTFRRSS